MAESRVKVEHDPKAQKFYVNFEEGILRKSCHLSKKISVTIFQEDGRENV